MFNPYGVIAVSHSKYREINFSDAQALIDWLISEDGRAAISAFKPKGEQLFFVAPAGKK